MPVERGVLESRAFGEVGKLFDMRREDAVAPRLEVEHREVAVTQLVLDDVYQSFIHFIQAFSLQYGGNLFGVPGVLRPRRLSHEGHRDRHHRAGLDVDSLLAAGKRVLRALAFSLCVGLR